MRPTDGLDAAQTAALVAELPPVFVCGPIAAAGEAARGGYQACNRRTIDALRELGVDARALPFPHPHAGGWRKIAEYAAGFVGLAAGVLRCPRRSIFHLTALSGAFVYPQWLLVQLARRRGLRVVFDQRAGGARLVYACRTPLYRAFFRSMTRSAHTCMVEGEALAGFLQQASGRVPIHLPNHLDVAAAPARADGSALPLAPTLIYVGRVVPEKGVEEVLEASRALRAGGLAARLQIVGDGERSYLAALRERYADVQAEWLGPTPADDVLALLARAHFFVFPTRHRGEGQSNALTEALACGCVPIASSHGFNEAVIGPAGATLPADAGPEQYAARIAELWQPARWRALSASARERAATLFATRPVMLRLLAQYHRLVGPFSS